MAPPPPGGADHQERLPFGLLLGPACALLARPWKSLPQLPRRGAGRWVAFQGLDRPQLPRRGTGRWVVMLASTPELVAPKAIQLLQRLIRPSQEPFALAAMLGQQSLTFLLAHQHHHTIHRGKGHQGETHRLTPELQRSRPAEEHGHEGPSRCLPVYLQAFPKVLVLHGLQVHETSPAQQLLQPCVLLLAFPYGLGH